MKKVSNSRIDRWVSCPFMDKLYSIDEIKRKEQNEHTAFGRTLHKCIEGILHNEAKTMTSLKTLFSKTFSKELSGLPKDHIDLLFRGKTFSKEENRQHLFDKRISLTDWVEKKRSTIQEMTDKGPYLAREAYLSLEKVFPKFALIGTEMIVENPFKEGWIFEGYLDIVFQKPNNKFVITDWKMSSYGWNEEQKIDEMKQKQLVLYKHFFCHQFEIPEDQVETFFGVCRRNAIKCENGKINIVENPIEFIEVKNPEIKKKTLKLLDDLIYNVEKENFVKNRTNCRRCLYHKKECFPDPFIQEKKK